MAVCLCVSGAVAARAAVRGRLEARDALRFGVDASAAAAVVRDALVAVRVRVLALDPRRVARAARERRAARARGLAVRLERVRDARGRVGRRGREQAWVVKELVQRELVVARRAVVAGIEDAKPLGDLRAGPVVAREDRSDEAGPLRRVHHAVAAGKLREGIVLPTSIAAVIAVGADVAQGKLGAGPAVVAIVVESINAASVRAALWRRRRQRRRHRRRRWRGREGRAAGPRRAPNRAEVELVLAELRLGTVCALEEAQSSNRARSREVHLQPARLGRVPRRAPGRLVSVVAKGRLVGGLGATDVAAVLAIRTGAAQIVLGAGPAVVAVGIARIVARVGAYAGGAGVTAVRVAAGVVAEAW